MTDNQDEILIHGFGISIFRSFGADEQFLGPLKKVNIIIGRNNSGKSNVLRFVRDSYTKIVHQRDFEVSQRDRPSNIGIQSRKITIAIPFNNDNNDDVEKLFNGKIIGFNANDDLSTLFGQHSKFHIELDSSNGHRRISEIDFGQHKNQSATVRLRQALSGRGGGGIDAVEADLANIFINRLLIHPKIKFIGAYRKYDSRLEEYEEDNGDYKNSNDKSIENLMALYAPAYDKQADKEKFLKIQNFLRKVTHEPTLEIHVPHNLKTINIKLHGKVLPIEALGTGIHELLIFAIQVISIDNHVVCIEEPELHFHPHMQRQFMQFLANETTNQYFITTHSSHVMDSVENATIHQVTLEDGFSKIHRPKNMNDKRRICQDLGYFPSDLLQSNSIIWVEGPSDRIYLNYWIEKTDPNLKEGWHYSIMFYGGGLRSHLTADDSEVGDFINLMPINRFPAILMDSDKKAGQTPLGKNKDRIIEEFKKINGFSWVTNGREIENYIPAEIRLNAIKAVHKSAVSFSEEQNNKYAKPLNYLNKENLTKTDGFNKVRIAKEAIAQGPELNVLDLSEKMRELVTYIQSANS